MGKMRFMAKWNWQSKDWTVFSHDAAALIPPLTAARRAQGEVLGLAKAIGMEEARNAQALIWASESLATAAIEGENLNLESVRSSIAKRLGLPGGTSSRERPVEGLLDMMQDATTGWEKPLTAERLCGWQNALFPAGFSSIHRVTAGKFREHQEPMQIVSGSLTKSVVHYQAPPSARVPAEINKFLKWFNGPSRKMDGLLRAGIAHLWFESIHPFEDGNGRVGRAIVDLALAQDLKSGLRLTSMATELSAQRDAYYAELAAASRAGADATRWLAWFCRTFRQACARSATVIDISLTKARFWNQHGNVNFSDSQRKVVNRLLDAGPRGFEGDLTTRKFLGMAGVSRATAFRDLAALVDAGVLGVVGQGKATRYFINLPGWQPQ
jgi:Fic family protein